jgi:hypothetical protein
MFGMVYILHKRLVASFEQGTDRNNNSQGKEIRIGDMGKMRRRYYRVILTKAREGWRQH